MAKMTIKHLKMHNISPQLFRPLFFLFIPMHGNITIGKSTVNACKEAINDRRIGLGVYSGTGNRLPPNIYIYKKNVTVQNHQFDIFSQFIEMDYLIVINENT